MFNEKREVIKICKKTIMFEDFLINYPNNSSILHALVRKKHSIFDRKYLFILVEN